MTDFHMISYGPHPYGLGEILSVQPKETAVTVEPRTVYAVTDGEYSDFRYKAIFENRADADQAQTAGLGDDVHEIRYYPAGAPLPTQVVYYRACANIRADGTFPNTEAEPRLWPYAQHAWTCYPDVPDLQRPVVQQTVGRGGEVWITVDAATEEAALKACSDRTAKVRAEILEGQRG